jgi:hypothetical protein
MSGANKCRRPSGAGTRSTETAGSDDGLKPKMSFPSGDEGLKDSEASARMARATLEPMVYAVLEHIVERAVARLWIRSMLGDAVGVPIKLAAEVLGCKESKIFELLSKGALQRVPRLGKETLISLASLKDLLAGGPSKKGRRKKGSGGGGGWSNGSALPAGMTSRVTPVSSSKDQKPHAPGEEIRKLAI